MFDSWNGEFAQCINKSIRLAIRLQGLTWALDWLMSEL